jgi:hypothetical protein
MSYAELLSPARATGTGRAEPASLRRALRQLREGPLSRTEVALAVATMPVPARRPWSQGEFLAAAVACPDLAEVRVDRRANLLRFIRVLARTGSWTEADPDPRATTRPTRERTCAMAGFCKTTFKECRAWWEARGFVAVVRQGRTAWARSMSKAAVLDYEGNDAAVFVFGVPQKTAPAAPAAQLTAGTRPPSGSVSGGDPPDPCGRGKTGDPTALRAGSFPKPALPRALSRYPVLEKLSDRAIRCFWRPFAEALWSVADWLHAVDHRPEGTQHRKDLSEVRHPAGWLRWRLSLWLDAAGRPVASRSQCAAAFRAADAARRDRERGELARVPGVPPGPEIARLREQRGWKQP